MKSVIIFLGFVFALLNFHCGSSTKVEKEKTTSKIEKTANAKGTFYYSCIYVDEHGDNSSVWFFNSQDSAKQLILKLPSNYGISADNFKLSPSQGFLAFYDYDSINNKTNVYSFYLTSKELAWLKSDRGNNGVDLVWESDSLLYCNLNSGDKDTYSKEKYTSLINVSSNKTIKNFTPARGNRLVGYVNNRYLLYEFDPGGSIYQNHYYLIEKNSNKIFKDFKKEDDSHGLVNFEVSPSGNDFFHIPYKIFKNDKGKSIREEELVAQNIKRSSEESIAHTQTGFTNTFWSPDGNVISFLKVGSINYNAATKKYTDIRYLYFYDVRTKQLSNLKTYQIEGEDGVQSEFDIPKALPDGSIIFNYLNYQWSPSGKYIFINRQDLTMNSALNNFIIYDNNSKDERTLIKNYNGNVKVIGWWNDELILLQQDDKYICYDLKNDKNFDIPITGKILYLKSMTEN